MCDMANITFTICGFIYVFILIIIFFSRKRSTHLETRLYSKLLVFTFLGTLFEIVNYVLLNLGISYNSFVYLLSSKLILVYYVFWLSFFSMYVNVISNREKRNKMYKYIILFLVLIEIYH